MENDGNEGFSSAFFKMRELSLGYLVARAIYVVVELGIPSFLKDGPLHIEVLAEKTKSNAETLKRLLYFLSTTQGIFSLKKSDIVEHNDLSASLCSSTLHDYILMINSHKNLHAVDQLLYSIQTGLPSFKKVHGCSIWEYYSKHPEDAATFNRTMSSMTRMIVPLILKAYNWKDAKTIVDVGGGDGTLLISILCENPKVNGILLDLPHTASRFEKKILKVVQT